MTVTAGVRGSGPAATHGSNANARRWWALAAVCLGQAMLMIDITIVVVALPDVGRDLGASFADVQLVVDAYALTLAASLLNMGALADRIGRRRTFVAGLLLFATASAICGAAPSAWTLIAARALQGVGGAILLATGLAIIGHEFPAAERARAIGIFGAVFGSAVAVGPLVGGALIDTLGWRWIFFANLPIAAIAVIVAARNVTEYRDPDPRDVDLAGQALFAVGVASVLIGLIRGEDWGWGAQRTLFCFAAAVVSLVAFVAVERRRRSPMFDLTLVRDRSFIGASIAAFATSASLFGMFVYLTIVLQIVERLTPLATGLRMLPVTLIAFVAAALAGMWSDRAPPRIVLAGSLASSAAGLFAMTAWEAGRSWTTLLPGLLLVGIGFGVANPTVAAVILRTAAPERSATATGMNSTFRQVGIAAGVAALGAVFQRHLAENLPGGAETLKPGARPDLAASAAPVLIDALRAVCVAGGMLAAAGALGTFLLVRSSNRFPASRGTDPVAP